MSAKSGQNIKEALNFACEELIRLNRKPNTSELETSKADEKILNNKGKITLNGKGMKLGNVAN